jgi:hypothetical protein
MATKETTRADLVRRYVEFHALWIVVTNIADRFAVGEHDHDPFQSITGDETILSALFPLEDELWPSGTDGIPEYEAAQVASSALTAELFARLGQNSSWLAEEGFRHARIGQCEALGLAGSTVAA